MNAGNLLAQACPGRQSRRSRESPGSRPDDKTGLYAPMPRKPWRLGQQRERARHAQSSGRRSFTSAGPPWKHWESGKIHAPPKPVATALKKDRGQAIQTLQAIGPAGCARRRAHLKDKDWAWQMDVCKILKVIAPAARSPPFRKPRKRTRPGKNVRRRSIKAIEHAKIRTK